MPSKQSRKYQRKIELIKDIVGTDVERELFRTSIVDVDIDGIDVRNTPSTTLFTSLESISGQGLSAIDIAARIDSLTKALKSNDGDELISRIANSSGGEVDPATVALEAALKSNDTDEFISRIADSTGSEIDPATTALENALKSKDTDQFVSRIAGTDGLEVEEDTLGNEIPPSAVALVTYLARALESQLEDSLRSNSVSDSEARFKHDNKTIPAGDSWYIPTGDDWRAGGVTLDGTLAVEGQVHTTGGISGNGTITGSGTVTLTSYT